MYLPWNLEREEGLRNNLSGKSSQGKNKTSVMRVLITVNNITQHASLCRGEIFFPDVCFISHDWLTFFSDTPCFPILLIPFCKWRWCKEEIWTVVLNGSSIVQNWTMIHMNFFFLKFFGGSYWCAFIFLRLSYIFSWQAKICNLTVCLVKSCIFLFSLHPFNNQVWPAHKPPQHHSLRTSFKRN